LKLAFFLLHVRLDGLAFELFRRQNILACASMSDGNPLSVAQVVEVGVDQLSGSHPVGNAYNISQALFNDAPPF
jgi:hypothetical protein